ncbi:glutaredoxin-related protein 5, mitochondrial-like [Antedon mediterranea]|uniref:glutaredoxin-related protein 5, mitochondrial-like n=1 Tax=Antedon mediterranea TaxID=105859 RepID=UPI003AF857BB
MNSIYRISPLLRQTLPRLSAFRLFSANAGSKENIESLVKDNKVVVFMKGDQEQPMCGFSNAVVQILKMHNVNFASHNVLDDDDLRQGIKDYSEWPTIPQVYMDGEFLGGCDIMLQMHQNGELIEELQKIGIRSALIDKEADEKK